MSKLFSLADRNILVTGASSGIGRAVTHMIAEAGASAIATGRNEDRLKETLAAASNPDKHTAIPADLTNTDQLADLLEACPPLDGIVLSAGKVGLLPVKRMTPEAVDEFMKINFAANVELVRSLFAKKLLKKGASVVALTSVTGPVIATRANHAYGASKAALTAFMRGCAVDLGKANIRFNCIAAGMVHTEAIETFRQSVGDESIQNDMKRYPLGRYGTPQEIAAACLYLLSDAAAWTTGSTLVIDGGLTSL